jgi:hypothetical protein
MSQRGDNASRLPHRPGPSTTVAHAGRKALTLYSVPPLDGLPNNLLLARMAGFSLHAATVCEAHQRSRLERLCRYITRPPIANQRLTVDGQGRVVYRYKQSFRDGSTFVVLEPLLKYLLGHFRLWPFSALKSFV